jgi:hypothetical protein
VQRYTWRKAVYTSINRLTGIKCDQIACCA